MISREDAQQRAQLWNDTYAYLDRFFAERGYTNVRTPIAVASPGMEPNLDPVGIDLNVIRRGKVRAGLITSPEYSMKKLLGAGMERIYTVTPVFRNVEELGGDHSIEFTMLEWYRQGADYHACMDETEALIDGFVGGRGERWPRFSYVDLLAAWQGARGATDEDTFNQHILPSLMVTYDRFFVNEFPIDQAALAQKSPDGRSAQRFEAYVGGMELCNGFTELVDANEQRARFRMEQEERRAAGKEVFPIDEELLSRLSSVASPTFGNALGVDRLVMLKAAAKDIDSIHLFPPSERFTQQGYGISE
ncbi:EF-P lysine aminoacylase GenX [Candidatus Uhrbacteria bacterium]|nr:EF-P lysine aminoacylase GenX [Candidatus Uhrbacteria bacterium]